MFFVFVMLSLNRFRHSTLVSIEIIVILGVVLGKAMYGEANTCLIDECLIPRNIKSNTDFLIGPNNGNNVNEKTGNSSCLPDGSQIQFFCKNASSHQLSPNDSPYRNCKRGKWRDLNNVEKKIAANCVKRDKHCSFPEIEKGTFVEIDNENFTSTQEGYYKQGTTATYTCINPQQQLQLNDTVQNTDQKFVRICNKIGQSFSWSRNAPYCDDRFSTEKTTNIIVKISTTSLGLTTSTSSVYKTGFKENSLVKEQVDRQKIYYILIGCCCVMAFVLIVMLFVYRKRLMTAFRKDCKNTRKYDDTNSHLVSEDKTRDCGETAGSSAQSSLVSDGHYQNIIPMKVNSEPVYIEVETGSLRATNNRKEAPSKALQLSDGNTNNGTNTDAGKPSTAKQSLTESHQSDTIYAEIHHEIHRSTVHK